MKRELKGDWRYNDRSSAVACFKTDPDEKGTERVVAVVVSRQIGQVSRLIPMKRELKGFQPELCSRRGDMGCFKTDPDEKGTESGFSESMTFEDGLFQD